MVKFVSTRIIKRIQWNTDLCSLKLAINLPPFIPGQTIQVGLPDAPPASMRPFFLANKADATFPEICVQRLPDDRFSNQLFHLQQGDALICNPHPAGTFTLNNVPDAEYLWLLAIDSGIAPLLSILGSPEPRESFEKVILAHELGTPDSLLYLEILQQLQQHHGEQFEFLEAGSLKQGTNACCESLADAIISGNLEDRLSINLSPPFSQIMVCAPSDALNTLLHPLELHGNRRRTPQRDGNMLIAATDQVI